MIVFKRFRFLTGLVLLLSLSACTDSNKPLDNNKTNQSKSIEHLIVYKSPTCGCCEKWVEHIEASGFSTEVEHPKNLDGIKDQYQVPSQGRSCHTAVSKQGFVFEGHIPARYIEEFLDSPPQGALGLSVPAMPLGSPGMEVEDRFMPYQVLLLKDDGSTEVFASVENAEQQYQKVVQP